ncbi:hypothetical protein J6590_101436 [Homalodisca vitripennis]|nr:hypothetical protein J6590_101436 [Homalodisca vitripennis]
MEGSVADSPPPLPGFMLSGSVCTRNTGRVLCDKRERPIQFLHLFWPFSWATGLCEDPIEENKGERPKRSRSMVLIIITTGSNRI